MDAFEPVVIASAVVAFNPASALRTPSSLTATPHTDLVDGQKVDCRATTATCVLFTYDQVFQTSKVSLTFDENGPVQPAFMVRPSPDPNDQWNTHTYDLVGFTSGDPFTVGWCNSDGACLSPNLASGTLDANGAATFTIDDNDPIPMLAVGDTTCAQGCAL